jgi:peptide/nickel transport system permease protein
MITFAFSRLLQAIPVLVTVAMLAFIMTMFVGDPVAVMLGQNATDEQRIAVTQALGLDQPIVVQFLKFLLRALHGDFGYSFRLARPVSELVIERFPATFELVFVSATLAIIIGIPVGVYTGIRRSSFLSRLIMISSLGGVSLPTFVIGIILIFIFSVLLGWLPSFGRGGVVQIGFWNTGLLTLSGLKAIVLPAITLSLFQMALIIRLVRAEMLDVLRSDFIKFAKARGLASRAIYFEHALKNALVPVITVIGLQIGGLLGFSLVTETVFQWPGLGLLLVQSIGVADIPVMSAYLVLVAIMFVVVNLVVDLLYYAIDPRLRTARRATAR